MKYEEALTQLETIVSQMEAGEFSVDEMAQQLKTAQTLIKECRAKLTKADAEMKKILDNGK